ncbi:MAG: polymerase, sigma-24 subunit, subfamily [Gemmatimonadetes bacterium]|nr:polymerase, sigma-24 subunit, subfamily [Gemmatimonadota bacterium]
MRSLPEPGESQERDDESDVALCAAIRGGSSTAFERLFRAHHPGMVAFATRMMGRGEVAEDLVQEVFLYVWRNRETWQVRTGVRQYLYSALRHGALRYIRHERVVRHHAPEAIALFDRAPRMADADLTARETVLLVREAIARLPERCRLVYTLHREQGLTYGEVAAVMGISAKTVDVQMGRALKSLRRSLMPHRD